MGRDSHCLGELCILAKSRGMDSGDPCDASGRKAIPLGEILELYAQQVADILPHDCSVA